MSSMRTYDVLYADPPWSYSFSPTYSRRIENQYPTMSVDAIKALKVPAKEDSALYLWATAPKLIEALEVLKAWGFTYKTHCIWDKLIVGMGHWFRGQHELILVGTRGKFSPPSRETRVASVIRERRTKHSRKPDIVREMIDRWFPGAAKLELFARDRCPGWDAWGNELHKTRSPAGAPPVVVSGCAGPPK